MKKLLVMAIVLFIPSLSYASIITFDYPGSAPASYTIPYSSTGPVSLSADYGNFVYAFQDSGVTFLNAKLTTSPYASDGHTMSDAGAAQYGTLGILFPSPVNYAALELDSSNGNGILSSIEAVNFNGSGYTTGGQSSVSVNTLAAALDISDAAGFNFLQVTTNSAQVDTVFYNYKDPRVSDPLASVPEPSTLLLFASGLMGLIGLWLTGMWKSNARTL